MCKVYMMIMFIINYTVCIYNNIDSFILSVELSYLGRRPAKSPINILDTHFINRKLHRSIK